MCRLRNVRLHFSLMKTVFFLKKKHSACMATSKLFFIHQATTDILLCWLRYILDTDLGNSLHSQKGSLSPAPRNNYVCQASYSI